MEFPTRPEKFTQIDSLRSLTCLGVSKNLTGKVISRINSAYVNIVRIYIYIPTEIPGPIFGVYTPLQINMSAEKGSGNNGQFHLPTINEVSGDMLVVKGCISTARNLSSLFNYIHLGR